MNNKVVLLLLLTGFTSNIHGSHATTEALSAATVVDTKEVSAEEPSDLEILRGMPVNVHYGCFNPSDKDEKQTAYINEKYENAKSYKVRLTQYHQRKKLMLITAAYLVRNRRDGESKMLEGKDFFELRQGIERTKDTVTMLYTISYKEVNGLVPFESTLKRKCFSKLQIKCSEEETCVVLVQKKYY